MEFKDLILYEDNHILIINKPAGWLSQGDQTGDKSVPELAQAFLKRRDNKPGNVFMGLPHRLDRPVSGILILSKTSKSLSRMTAMFKNREVHKVYHALIKDKIYREPERVVNYLKKDTKRNRAIVSDKPFKHAKEAILSYEVVAIIEKFSLVSVTLETGRPHQIRAQLAFHKMPIHGDSKYSGKKPLRDKSIALHSREVQFTHPVSGEKVHVTAPYPDTPWWNLFRD